ncbi:MAG: hypothetical protein ABIY50_07620 [Ignavibacteria bacterium]
MKELYQKKINPVTGNEIDPMFDGHLEKPISNMTPKEKLDYLWLQTMFKWQIRNRVINYKSKTENSE